MKYILSWGGGVNSTAILAMIKLGMLPELTPENTEIVFADTGAEMPYTYEHTTRCIERTPEWIWRCLRPTDERWKKFYSPRCQGVNLYQFCLDRQWIPSRMSRWCTKEYKVNPISNYRKTLGDTIIILGIATEEIHRAKELGNRLVMYPLIDKGIDREGCYKLIKQAGLPEAQKSGCYFCPFQKKQGWIDLSLNYKDLFNECIKLENNAHLKWSESFSLAAIPLEKQIAKWKKMADKKCKQKDLFETERHCLCEL
jgi:hypothetical protein